MLSLCIPVLLLASWGSLRVQTYGAGIQQTDLTSGWPTVLWSGPGKPDGNESKRSMLQRKPSPHKGGNQATARNSSGYIVAHTETRWG